MKIVKNFDVLKSTKFNNVVLTLTDKKETHCNIQAMSLSGSSLFGIYFFRPQALSFNCQKSKGR